MDKQKLKAQLEELHGELHKIGSVGQDERRLLEKLAADVRVLLDRGELEPDHYQGLGERLRNAVAELESEHPTTTMRLRDLITQLSYLGV